MACFGKREGSAVYKQWIINGGLQYKFFLNLDWTLGINGGLTYLRVSEEQKNPDGTAGSSSDGSGIFGFFIGTTIEKNFGKSPFSIFIEPQYNIARSNTLMYIGNLGGFNINTGVRYYFKERRFE